MSTTLAERFWDKVSPEPNTGCWLWAAYLTPGGYGRIRSDGGRDGRPLAAHRVSYELHVGPIPEGLQIDHLCRQRCCVNPEHLEAVTGRENTLRGESLSAKRARQTHCQRGHALPAERDKRGRRRCMVCRRARRRLVRSLGLACIVLAFAGCDAGPDDGSEYPATTAAADTGTNCGPGGGQPGEPCETACDCADAGGCGVAPGSADPACHECRIDADCPPGWECFPVSADPGYFVCA